VNATFENGMLKITIPKREEAKPKQIKIASGSANGVKTESGKTAGQQQQQQQKTGKEKAA